MDYWESFVFMERWTPLAFICIMGGTCIVSSIVGVIIRLVQMQLNRTLTIKNAAICCALAPFFCLFGCAVGLLSYGFIFGLAAILRWAFGLEALALFCSLIAWFCILYAVNLFIEWAIPSTKPCSNGSLVEVASANN